MVVASSFQLNMKIHFSIKRSGINGGIAILFGLALPNSLLLAQSASSAEYTSVDISSAVTAGPVINAKTITSSPPKPAGNLKTEAGARQFPVLLPPMKHTGAALEQIDTTTALAAVRRSPASIPRIYGSDASRPAFRQRWEPILPRAAGSGSRRRQ